MAAALNF